MDAEDKLENWKMVLYRMKTEGMDYCFKHYSSFKEIDDQQFHLLRILLIDTMEKIEKLVENRIDTLEKYINEYE
mgnify:CR=1 FL=1